VRTPSKNSRDKKRITMASLAPPSAVTATEFLGRRPYATRVFFPAEENRQWSGLRTNSSVEEDFLESSLLFFRQSSELE
jgi:hypothetical protein